MNIISCSVTTTYRNVGNHSLFRKASNEIFHRLSRLCTYLKALKEVSNERNFQSPVCKSLIAEKR
jgi:hypothetical protein